MRKIIIIALILISAVAKGQIYTNDPSYGKNFNRINTLTVFQLPSDTTLDGATNPCAQIAKIDNTIYTYNCDSTKWVQIVGASHGDGISAASNGLNIDGATVKLGGTLEDTTIIDVNSQVFYLYGHSQLDDATFSFESNGGNSYITASVVDTVSWNGEKKSTYNTLTNSGISLLNEYANYTNGSVDGSTVSTQFAINQNNITQSQRSQLGGTEYYSEATEYLSYLGYFLQWISNPNNGGIIQNRVLSLDSTGLGFQTTDGTGAAVEALKVGEHADVKLGKYKNNSVMDSVLVTDIDGNVLLKSLDEDYIKNNYASKQTASAYIDSLRAGTVRANGVFTGGDSTGMMSSTAGIVQIRAYNGAALVVGVGGKRYVGVNTFNANSHLTTMGSMSIFPKNYDTSTLFSDQQYSSYASNDTNIVYSLPQASLSSGRIYEFKKIKNSAGLVIVQATPPGDSIDHKRADTLLRDGDAIKVQAVGNTWQILSKYSNSSSTSSSSTLQSVTNIGDTTNKAIEITGNGFSTVKTKGLFLGYDVTNNRAQIYNYNHSTGLYGNIILNASGGGLVGIGKTSPAEALDVNGNIAASAPAYSTGGYTSIVKNNTSNRFETKIITQPIKDFYTDATGSDTLFAYTIPASYLTNDGDKINFTYAGIFDVTGATTHTVGVAAGGSTMANMSNGTTSGGSWKIEGTIIRVSNTVVRYIAQLHFDNTGVSTNLSYTVPGEITGLNLSSTGLRIGLPVASPNTNVTAKMGSLIYYSAAQ